MAYVSRLAVVTLLLGSSGASLRALPAPTSNLVVFYDASKETVHLRFCDRPDGTELNLTRHCPAVKNSPDLSRYAPKYFQELGRPQIATVLMDWFLKENRDVTARDFGDGEFAVVLNPFTKAVLSIQGCQDFRGIWAGPCDFVGVSPSAELAKIKPLKDIVVSQIGCDFIHVHGRYYQVNPPLATEEINSANGKPYRDTFESRWTSVSDRKAFVVKSKYGEHPVEKPEGVMSTTATYTRSGDELVIDNRVTLGPRSFDWTCKLKRTVPAPRILSTPK